MITEWKTFWVVFGVAVNYCHSQDQDGFRITLRGREIPDHGLLDTREIGTNDTNLSGGLACTHPSGRHGNWIRPDGYTIRPISSELFWIKQNTQRNTVYLFRNRDREDIYVLLGSDGIWRCVFPGREQTKHVGIYFTDTRGILSPGTPGDIQFSLLSEDPVAFNLTFNTTGGPASYVTWTRDGVNITTLNDDHFVKSQMVDFHLTTHFFQDGSRFTQRNYESGNYSNTLTVIGRLPGVYGVSVTNDRTPEPVNSTITVFDFSHPNVSASRSEDLRRINISWSLNYYSRSYLSRYTIQFRTCSPDDCGSRGFARINSINVNARTTYLLSDVTLWTTYNITVVAHFNQPSNVSQFHILPREGPVYRTVETRGVSSPVITSVSELANITSVHVTWEQPEGGVAVDEYVVSYRCLNGTNGQCQSFQDGNTVAFRGDSRMSVATFSMTLHVRAYSIYIVNVIGRSGALHNSSALLQFKTNSSVPSRAPQNLTIVNFTSTNVTISWSSVECIHRNGLITHYVISYGSESGPVKNITVNISEPNDGGRYTATGLDPAVSYVFKVAAVNDVGVGVFATARTESKGRQLQAGSNNITIIAGVVTVVLVLLLALVIVGAIYVAFRVHKKKSLPEKTPNQVIYEEPYFPSPTEELKMETCPAYDVNNVKKS